MRAWTLVWWGAIGLLLLASLAMASPVFAADTFVDQSIGLDSNSCINPAHACLTIGAAILKAGTNDTIHVGPGVYSEQLSLDNGKSLKATGTPASTVITAPTAPTIDVPTAAGTIEGFTIRSGATSTSAVVVQLDALATVQGNVFDTDGSDAVGDFPVDVRVGGAAASSVVRNSFTDDGAGSQAAIDLRPTAATATPSIADNQINGLAYGVLVDGGAPTISGNVIVGAHNAPSANQGAGVIVSPSTVSATPTLTANFIHGPVAGASGVNLIDLSNGSGVPNDGATMSRNRILGGQPVVQVSNTVLPVTLDSDLISGGTSNGLFTADTGSGGGNVTATNVTVASNVIDIGLQNTSLSLDSSIVEDAIGTSGTVSCTITFSRGPTTTGTGCQTFQTNASPLFVSSSDFHLQAASTMIDAGNTAAPPAGSLDFDGDPRAQIISCLGGGSARRDVGADEFAPPANCTPPDTSINSGPATGGTSSAAPSFAFSSPTAPPETFQCSLDSSTFSTCTSPVSYEGLTSGSHTFVVRAVNSSGIGDTTPATRTFTVDASTPETEIDSGPAAAATTGPSTAFTFSSEPGATFECSLDGAAFAACSSGGALTGLATASHTFIVRAVDAVGNQDPTASSRTWTVDATPPETAIDSGPADGSSTTDTTATYGFSSEAGATFECSLDGGAFAACTSPKAIAGLALGAHTFAVRATDTFGNVDSTPASRVLTVTQSSTPPRGGDTDAPETTIKKVRVKDSAAQVKFKSSEPGSTFECKLDKAKFKPCSSPERYHRLDTGKHKVRVQATDAAGNTDSSPAKAKFKVEDA
jgi:hypothetical protein